MISYCPSISRAWNAAIHCHGAAPAGGDNKQTQYPKDFAGEHRYHSVAVLTQAGSLPHTGEVLTHSGPFNQDSPHTLGSPAKNPNPNSSPQTISLAGSAGCTKACKFFSTTWFCNQVATAS